MIQLFCPTRGRSQAAAELMTSFRETAVMGGSMLTFLVDDDDPTLYPSPVIRAPNPTPGSPVGPLNRAALVSAADVVGFIGDDSRLATPGWDAQVERALRDPGFCWGDDGHDKPWPSTCFISKAIVDRLGYMVPPGFRRGFFDMAWIDLATHSGTAHIVSCRFPHDNSGHPVDSEIIAADEKFYQDWRGAHGMLSDIAKIRLARDLAHFFPAAVKA